MDPLPTTRLILIIVLLHFTATAGKEILMKLPKLLLKLYACDLNNNNKYNPILYICDLNTCFSALMITMVVN